MRVRFWGVRGSVPWATPGSIGHGCNTACVEIVEEQSGRRLILDAGSGIVGLKIKARSRWSDVLITALTAGLIVPRSVTFEGVVTK